MTKSGRRNTETPTPKPRNRMIPLLVAIVFLLAARYWSQLNTPQPPEPQPPQNAPGVEASATPDLPANPQATVKPQATAKPQASDDAKATASPSGSAESSRLVIRDLALRDQDGRVIYRGDIDLRPTLARIDAGKKLRFPNDGSVFQNREGRLPKHASGYYREWVVPTPNEDGPGPQRIVTGDAGETWYTADHYRSFQRLPREARRSE